MLCPISEILQRLMADLERKRKEQCTSRQEQV